MFAGKASRSGRARRRAAADGRDTHRPRPGQIRFTDLNTDVLTQIIKRLDGPKSLFKLQHSIKAGLLPEEAVREGYVALSQRVGWHPPRALCGGWNAHAWTRHLSVAANLQGIIRNNPDRARYEAYVAAFAPSQAKMLSLAREACLKEIWCGREATEYLAGRAEMGEMVASLDLAAYPLSSALLRAAASCRPQHLCLSTATYQTFSRMWPAMDRLSNLSSLTLVPQTNPMPRLGFDRPDVGEACMMLTLALPRLHVTRLRADFSSAQGPVRADIMAHLQEAIDQHATLQQWDVVWPEEVSSSASSSSTG